MPSFQEMMDAATAVTNPVAPQASLPSSPLAQISELLGPKAQEVAAASAAKKVLLSKDGTQQAFPTQDDLYRANVARKTGAGVDTTPQLEADLRDLTPSQLTQKYGPQQAMDLMMGNASAGAAATRDKTIGRTPGDEAYDLGTGAGLGFVNAVGGIAAGGVGLVSPEAGVAGAKAVTEINDTFQKSQSEALNARRKFIGTQNALDYRDSAEQEKQDIANGSSPLVAKVSRELRNAGNAVINNATDGVALSDIGASGVGSLLAAGPVGKVVGLGGKAIGAVAGLRGAGAVAAKAAQVGEAAKIPVAVGLMEGGGAYQQTADQVAKTSFEDLAKNSPDFVSLVQGGMSQEDARTELANKAGLIAGAIQAPIAAATGVLVSKFEAHPFSTPSLRAAGRNILNETAEEFTQSATGQIAQNVGVRATSNQNQDVLEGVGEQAGLGALGGALSAGGVQAPRALGQTAVAGAKLAGTAAVNIGSNIAAGVSFLGGKLLDRGERVQAANSAASPVSATKVSDAAQTAAAEAPVAAQTIKEAVNAVPESATVTSEAKATASTYVDDLVKATQFDPSFFADTPQHLQDTVAGSKDNLDAMSKLSKAAKADTPEGVMAGQALNYMLNSLEETLVKDPEALRNLDPKSPAYDMVQKYRTLINDMNQTDIVADAKKSVEKAAESASKIVEANPLTTTTDLNSPEGQRAVQAHMAMLELDPSKLSADSVDALISHADALGLNQARRTSLQVISETLKAARDESAQRAALGLRPQDTVNREILTDESGAGGKKQSVAQYAKGVRLAYNAGNLDEAGARLTDLMQFAEHMGNKVDAINSNVTGRDVDSQGKSFYRTLVDATNRVWRDGTTGLQIHPTAAGSIRFAQELSMEAETVARVANALADAYPELGVSHIKVSPLHESLIGNADALAQTNRDQRMVKPVEPKASPVEEKGSKQEPAAEGSDANRKATTQPDQVVSEKVDVPEQDSTQKTFSNVSTLTDEELANQTKESESSDTTVEPAPTTQAEGTNENSTADEIAGQSAVPSAEKKTGTAKVFPDLVSTANGTNHFVKAFTVRAEETSRMLREESPADMVAGALKSEQSLTSFLGSTISRKLTPEIAKAYASKIMSTVQPMLEDMTHSLGLALAKSPKTGANAGKSLQARLEAGEDVLRFENTKVLNIVEKQEDGSYRFNPQLAESGLLAGLQWTLSSGRDRTELDDKSIAAQFGISEDQVNDDMRNIMKLGSSTAETLQAIANKVENYWGMKTNSDVGTGLTQGIPMAMATEALTALVKNGLVTEFTIRVTQDGEVLQPGVKAGKDVKVVELNRYSPSKDIREDDNLAAFPDAIDRAMLVKPTPVHFFGSDRPQVAPFQMRSRYVLNTDAAKVAIQANQSTPYFKNSHMASFFLDGLGLSNVLELLGNGNISKQKWNVAHLATVEGQNAALTDAFGYIGGMMAELSNAADVAGVDADRHPVHFGFNMSKVGRLQMLGSYTPQSNKVMREILMPTRSVMDLSDPDSFSTQAFRLAQAQALGIKVHQITRDNMMTQLNSLLTGKLRESVAAMQDWTQRGGQISTDVVKTLKAELGGDMSAVALHALVEEGRYQNASPAERAAFETHLYVEADGVTNGPINSMGLLTMGQFDKLFVDNMAKGGLFIGEPDKTMNIHREFDDGIDLYKATTNTMSETMAAGLRVNPVGSPLGDQMRHLYTLMDQFFGKDLSFDSDTGVLKLDRGIAKNPLTITVYGSGAKGIAGKMTQLLMEKISERMTKAAQDETEIFTGPTAEAEIEKYSNAVNALVNNSVRVNKDLKMFVAKTPVSVNRTAEQWSNEGFQFHPDEIKNIEANMHRLFVTPMRSAISTNTGESLNRATTVIQKATQIQSFFLAQEFKRLMDEKLAEKSEDSSWAPGEFLSQKDFDEIHKKLAPLHPMVETGTQQFYIANSQNGEQKRRPLAVSLDGDVRANQFVEGPANAGVSGIASLVIGTGDGAMMQNASQNPDVIRGTLPVFDGINLPLDNIERASRGMNQAVYDSWQGNPMKAVAEMFSGMLDNITQNALEDPSISADLIKALNINPDDVTTQSLLDGLAILERQLHVNAMEIDARHAVLARVQTSIDQMASVGAPFQTLGKEVITGTSEEKAAALNDLLKEEMGKIPFPDFKERNVDELNAYDDPEVKSEFDLDESPISEPDPVTEEIVPPTPVVTELPALPVSKTPYAVDVKADFSKFGTEDNGVRVGDVTDINKLLRKVKKTTATAAETQLVGEMVRGLSADGWRIVTGEPATVLSWFQQNGMPVYQPTPEEQKTGNLAGFADSNHKVIAVMNGSLETTIHELIHAAVGDSVNAFYNGDEIDLATRAALTNVETLMEQFLGLDAGKVSPEMQQVLQHAQRIIAQERDAGRPASAMNEFMAWGLANRKLAQVQKETVANPLVRMATNVFNLVKKLVWGRKVAPEAPGQDMLSNLLFNTAVVMRRQSQGTTLSNQASAQIQAHNALYGQDDRLASVKQTFKQVIVDHVNEKFSTGQQLPPAQQAKRAAETAALLKDNDTMLTFANAGLLRTAQERDTFNMVVSALGTEARINGNSMTRANELYDHAVKNLTVEDFMEDPVADHPADRYFAQRQYSTLMGLYGVKMDSSGRSTLLPSFIALAMTSEKFRGVLAEMDVPKNTPKDWGTADSILQTIGTAAMEELSKRMSGEGNSKNVLGQIDALVDHITDEVQAQNNRAEDFYTNAGGFLENLNEKTRVGLEALSSKVVDKANDIAGKTNSKVIQGVANAAALIASIGSEAKGEQVARGIQEGLNKSKIMRPLYELLTDMIGRTLDNAEIYDKIKTVRAYVQQVRQGYVEHVPTVIAKKFTRELDAGEWTNLHNGIAKTDMASLIATGMGINKVMNLIDDPAARSQAISDLETQIAKLDAPNSKRLLEKAQQLATFMVEGTPGINLLRNAEAVSQLFGEKVVAGRGKPDAALVRAIDHLVSLYALDKQAPEVHTSLSSLVQNEGEGVKFALQYLVGQRVEEQRKAESSPAARFNAYKGFIPSNQEEGVHLIVADDKNYKDLVEQSYKRVGDYVGSNIDPSQTSRGYYYSATPSRGTFQQGILQNVRTTANGVDAATGFTLGMTAGRVQDRQLVNSIYRNMGREKGTENLMPVYNEKGIPTAYERSIDPAQRDQLNYDTNLAKNIGIWRGRQAEEQAGQIYNQYLLDSLKKMYDTDVQRGSEKGQYINLFDKAAVASDPVLRDAVALMTPETIGEVKKRFGDKNFFVRKDMLNDAMGYRSASVGDAWTGTSRWSQQTRDQVKNLALSVMGNDAYAKLTKYEKVVQGFVTDAKVTIVVKSMVVPMFNFVSNIYQLAGRGVPLLSIVRGMPRKTAEVDAYVKSKLRSIDAEAELRAAEGNSVLQRKLTAEIQSINDAHKRMSIWPLIEAGEFSSISDAGISRDEILLSSGRLNAYMETLANKLPGAAKTVGRYALVTKDTALFEGLQKAVEYGDFLAKAVLYDDLTQRKKLTKEQALARVTEEFVNYDRLPGRARGYVESMGLGWFWNFKIRSTKVALSMIRNNPVHALLAGLTPSPAGVGTPIGDNMFSKGFSGALWNSFGISQGLRAPMMNPWVELMK